MELEDVLRILITAYRSGDKKITIEKLRFGRRRLLMKKYIFYNKSSFKSGIFFNFYLNFLVVLIANGYLYFFKFYF